MRVSPAGCTPSACVTRDITWRPRTRYRTGSSRCSRSCPASGWGLPGGMGASDKWYIRPSINTGRRRSRMNASDTRNCPNRRWPTGPGATGPGGVVDPGGGLPDGYRLVFNLYAIEGYDHREIAELLGIRGKHIAKPAGKGQAHAPAAYGNTCSTSSCRTSIRSMSSSGRAWRGLSDTPPSRGPVCSAPAAAVAGGGRPLQAFCSWVWAQRPGPLSPVGPGNIEADGLVGHAFVDHQGSSATDQQGDREGTPSLDDTARPRHCLGREEVRKGSDRARNDHGGRAYWGWSNGKVNALEVPPLVPTEAWSAWVPSGAGDEVQPAPQVERPPTATGMARRIRRRSKGSSCFLSGPAWVQPLHKTPGRSPSYCVLPTSGYRRKSACSAGIRRHVGDDAALAADRDRSLSPGREMGSASSWAGPGGTVFDSASGFRGMPASTRSSTIPAGQHCLGRARERGRSRHLVIAQATDSVGTIYARASRTTGTTRLESWWSRWRWAGACARGAGAWICWRGWPGNDGGGPVGR